MDRIITRDLLETVSRHLDDEKIIGVRGPRQSGKSTLLKLVKQRLIERGVPEKSITLLTFEDPGVLDDFVKDPVRMLKSYVAGDSRHYFLLDEVQYDKGAGKRLKLVFDTMEGVKLIVTGSSSLDIAQVSKFLVGRMLMYELYPLSFGEYLRYEDERLYRIFMENNEGVCAVLAGKAVELELDGTSLGEINSHFMKYITYGGYPDVARHANNTDKMELLKNIYTTYVGKDIATLFGIDDTMKLRRVLIILASQIGSLANYNDLANNTGTYYKELMQYMGVLEETYIINQLRPFHKNMKTELRKNPKIYMLDLGMRNYLVNNFNDLERREDAGHIVENFAFSELFRNLEPNRSLYFWRTLTKAEVDFILWDQNAAIPIEIKFSGFRNAEITRGMRSFISEYKPRVAGVATRDFIKEVKIDSTAVFFVPVAFL